MTANELVTQTHIHNTYNTHDDEDEDHGDDDDEDLEDNGDDESMMTAKTMALINQTGLKRKN